MNISACRVKTYYYILITGKERNKMNISDVRIRKTMNEARLRAVVSLTVDNSLAIHDIKIIQGDERLFVAMPSRRDDAGNFRDIEIGRAHV